jgi:hypothetical protein
MTWWLIMDRLEHLLKAARVPKEGLKTTIRAILPAPAEFAGTSSK